MKSTAILLHQNELSSVGLEIHPIGKLSGPALNAHRDDHYMFVLQQNGVFYWEVDFREIRLTGSAVCYITPGQVHRYIDIANSEGWLIFVDARLISGQYRDILYAYLHTSQMASVIKEDSSFKLQKVLADLLARPALVLQRSLVISAAETLTGLIASHIVQSQTSVELIGGQKYNHVLRFKLLIAEKHKTTKEVKAYAALLHITPLYLNEIVKVITGFPASYWISQEILLEAKRLLYYTILDVKQIAYELGYDDPAYFSRYFKKHSGVNPLTFRDKNHYLSNHST